MNCCQIAVKQGFAVKRKCLEALKKLVRPRGIEPPTFGSGVLGRGFLEVWELPGGRINSGFLFLRVQGILSALLSKLLSKSFFRKKKMVIGLFSASSMRKGIIARNMSGLLSVSGVRQ